MTPQSSSLPPLGATHCTPRFTDDSHIISVCVGPSLREEDSVMIAVNDEPCPAFVSSPAFHGYISVRMSDYRGLPGSPIDPPAAHYLAHHAKTTSQSDAQHNKHTADTHPRFFTKLSNHFNGTTELLTPETANATQLEQLRTIVQHPKSNYFKGRSRRYSIMVQGRFKKELQADDVMFGFDFDNKIRSPIGSTLAVKIAKWLDPSLDADLNSDTPFVYSPMVSAMNAMAVYPLYSNVLRLGDPYADEYVLYCIQYELEKAAKASIDPSGPCSCNNTTVENSSTPSLGNNVTTGLLPANEATCTPNNLYGHHKFYAFYRRQAQLAASGHSNAASGATAASADQSRLRKLSGFTFGFFGSGSTAPATSTAGSVGTGVGNSSLSDGNSTSPTDTRTSPIKGKSTSAITSEQIDSASLTLDTKKSTVATNDMLGISSPGSVPPMNKSKSAASLNSLVSNSATANNGVDYSTAMGNPVVHVANSDLSYIIGPVEAPVTSQNSVVPINSIVEHNKKAGIKNHPFDDIYVGRWMFASTMIPENTGLLFSPHVLPDNKFNRRAKELDVINRALTRKDQGTLVVVVDEVDETEEDLEKVPTAIPPPVISNDPKETSSKSKKRTSPSASELATPRGNVPRCGGTSTQHKMSEYDNIPLWDDVNERSTQDTPVISTSAGPTSAPTSAKTTTPTIQESNAQSGQNPVNETSGTEFLPPPKVVDFTCKCPECLMKIKELSGGDPSKLPLTYEKRKKFFADQKHRQALTLYTDRVYCMDFYDAYFDMQALMLRLPGVNVDIRKYWDGQPLRFVCKSKKSNEVLFSIWFKFVDVDKKDDYIKSKLAHQEHMFGPIIPDLKH